MAVRIGGGFTAQWLTGFQIGNAIDPYGSFLRFGGSSAESGATLGTVPYTIGTAFDLNDLVVNGVCNAGVVTPVSFTGSIASSGVMTTTGSPSLSVGQYIYKYAGGANTPVGNTHITGGSGNSWTTAPTLQTITSTTLVAGGAYGFGQLGCPQSGGAGHRYMATRVGTGIIGNGDIYVGDGVLHAITGGMLIDSFNQKMTATTLAANSDGTFWTTGDLAEDPCGDQGTVTASAGAVSGVTITLAGYAEAGSTGECPASGGNIYWRPKFQATPNGTTGENAFQTPFSVSLTSYTWTQGTLLQFGGVAKLATFGTATSVPLHLASAQTTAPVLTSCGTGSPTIVGSDTAGTITMGTSATGCIATFNVSYTSAPHCTVTWRATPLLSQSYVVAAATITLTQTSASGNLVDYVCVAPAGVSMRVTALAEAFTGDDHRGLLHLFGEVQPRAVEHGDMVGIGHGLGVGHRSEVDHGMVKGGIREIHFADQSGAFPASEPFKHLHDSVAGGFYDRIGVGHSQHSLAGCDRGPGGYRIAPLGPAT